MVGQIKELNLILCDKSKVKETCNELNRKYYAQGYAIYNLTRKDEREAFLTYTKHRSKESPSIIGVAPYSWETAIKAQLFDLINENINVQCSLTLNECKNY